MKRTAEDRAQKAEIILGKIFAWTREYGKALCPGAHPDSFGEGMREAKKQIKKILNIERRDSWLTK